MKTLKKGTAKRPESAAFTPTDDNEVSKADLAKAEEDKSSIGKSDPAMISTTILQFLQLDVGDDDSKDDITDDPNLYVVSQSEANQTSLQAKPEMAVNQKMPHEQEDSHFSSVPVDDKIPLI